MSFDAPKVYSEEMIRFSGEWLGGYPLWYPEPDGDREVQIGDVGYIFGGRFKRLFNVLEARKADQVQPKGFKPLEYNMKDGIDIRPRYLAPGTHASKTVTVLQGEVKGKAAFGGGAFASKCLFDSTHARGAVLHLKGHATSARVISQGAWQEYAKKHSRSWAPFVKTVFNLGFEPKNLILVTGHVKCAHWAVAAFEKKDKSSEAYIKAGFDFANGKFAFKMTKEQSMFSSHMSGPKPRSIFRPSKKDQCIFLSGIVGRQRFPSIRLRGGAASAEDSLADENIDDSSPFSAAIPQEDDTLPWSTLLDYILERSDAQSAIASDKELDLLLGEDVSVESDDVPVISLSNVAQYLRNERFPIDVENGVGTLSLICLVQRAQARRERLLYQRLRQQGVRVRRRDIEHDGDSETNTLEEVVLADGRRFRWLDILFSLGRAADGSGSLNTAFSTSRDGETIVTCTPADGVVLWNSRTGIYIRRFPITDASLVALSPDGTKFVAASQNSPSMVWSTEHATMVELRGGRGASFVAYSSDGNTIATASHRETAQLWGPEGALRHALAFDGQTAAMAFSPDGTVLLVAADAAAYLWSCESGERLATLRGHGADIRSAAFSRHGDCVATGSDDHTVRIWDAHTGSELVKMEHAGRILAVAFSPEGHTVVSGASDGSIVFSAHSAEGWKEAFETDVRRRSGAVYSLAYSHDGRLMASGDAGGLVKVWDGVEGSFVAEFCGHDGRVATVAWTPDDMSVVSSSDDGFVRAWNVHDVLRFC